MHQKKIPRVKNILHSIPILHSSSYTTNSNNRSIVIKNKHLRYVSSSIPLACIVALLLLSICIISPDGFGIGSSFSAYAEDGISTQADIQSPTASASLSIEGDLAQTTSAGMGNGPAYNSTGSGIANGELLPMSSTNPKQGKIMFAAKFGDNAIAGHYKTAVLLSLIATPQTITVTDYNISFDCKGGSNCPANVSITESREPTYTYTIPSLTTNNPTRDNYTFLGYSTDSNATTADANYAPGKTITISSSSPSLKLYAVWKENLTWNNITTMQQMTGDICASVSNGTSKTLIDARDGKSYKIMRLEDGRCWMTENLRLDISKANSLTSENSNITEGTTWPTKDLPVSQQNPTDLSLPRSGYVFTDTTEHNNNPFWNSGDVALAATSAAYDSKINGYYYNWCAATAGCNSSTSICPKGWKLPSNTDFNVLKSKDGGWRSSPRGRVLSGALFYASGNISGGSLILAGLYGFYWSSTDAYYLQLGDNDVSVMSNKRFTGCAVQCIAE